MSVSVSPQPAHKSPSYVPLIASTLSPPHSDASLPKKTAALAANSAKQ